MRKTFLLKSPFQLMAIALLVFVFSSCSRNSTSVSQWTKLEYQKAMVKQQPIVKSTENSIVENELKNPEISTIVAKNTPTHSTFRVKTKATFQTVTSKIAENKIAKKIEKSGKFTIAFKSPSDSHALSTQADGGLRSALLFGLIGLILLILASVITGLVGTILYVVGSILVVVGIIYLILWLLNA